MKSMRLTIGTILINILIVFVSVDALTIKDYSLGNIQHANNSAELSEVNSINEVSENGNIPNSELAHSEEFYVINSTSSDSEETEEDIKGLKSSDSEETEEDIKARDNNSNRTAKFFDMYITLGPSQEIKDDFSYTKPDQLDWPNRFGKCGGDRQSPIALNKDNSIVQTFPAIKLVGYKTPITGKALTYNDGHSITRKIPKNALTPYVTINKGHKYKLEQFHFHWGPVNDIGSEHVVGNRRFPLEIHFVHRNSKYASIDEAVKHRDGLKVLAFLFKLSDHTTSGLKRFADTLKYATYAGSSYYDSYPFKLISLIGNVNLKKYYLYSGSLTTPTCAQAVTWYVFPDPIPVTAQVLKKFRNLKDSHYNPIKKNFRMLQPRNGRKVYFRIPFE